MPVEIGAKNTPVSGYQVSKNGVVIKFYCASTGVTNKVDVDVPVIADT